MCKDASLWCHPSSPHLRCNGQFIKAIAGWSGLEQMPKSHIPPWTNNNNSKDNALSTVFPARSCLPDNLCPTAYIRLCARWLSKDTTRRCPCIAAHNGQHRRTRLHQSNSAQEKWRALGNCQLRHTASQEDMHLSAPTNSQYTYQPKNVHGAYEANAQFGYVRSQFGKHDRWAWQTTLSTTTQWITHCKPA